MDQQVTKSLVAPAGVDHAQRSMPEQYPQPHGLNAAHEPRQIRELPRIRHVVAVGQGRMVIIQARTKPAIINDDGPDPEFARNLGVP